MADGKGYAMNGVVAFAGAAAAGLLLMLVGGFFDGDSSHEDKQDARIKANTDWQLARERTSVQVAPDRYAILISEHEAGKIAIATLKTEVATLKANDQEIFERLEGLLKLFPYVVANYKNINLQMQAAGKKPITPDDLTDIELGGYR